MAGYIQTPGWNPEDGTTYPSDMDSWVSIPVPQDHKVIVTVIDIDTEDSETCQYDWLELFLLLQQDLDAGTTTANVPSASNVTARQDTAKMDDDTPTSDRKTDLVDSWNHGGTPNRTKNAADPNFAYAQPASKSKVYTEKDAFHIRTFKASEHYGAATKASTDPGTTMTFSGTTRGENTETKPKRAWRTCGSTRPDVVMAEASVVHVNFHSDASRQHTGARIFFSFHKVVYDFLLSFKIYKKKKKKKKTKSAGSERSLIIKTVRNNVHIFGKIVFPKGPAERYLFTMRKSTHARTHHPPPPPTSPHTHEGRGRGEQEV